MFIPVSDITHECVAEDGMTVPVFRMNPLYVSRQIENVTLFNLYSKF